MKKINILIISIIILILSSSFVIIPGCTSTSTAETTAAAAETTEAAAETTAAAAETTEAAAETTAAETVAQGTPVKVAFISPEQTNESSQRQWKQLQNEVEGRGWEIVATELQATYEADAERTAFIRVMEKNPDAIVVAYVELNPLKDLCLEAESKGIGVYIVGEAWVPGMVGSFKSDDSIIGAQIGSYAIERLMGSAKNVGFLDLWMPRGARRDIVVAAMFEKGGYDVGNTEHHMVTPEGYTDEIFSTASQWITKYGKDIPFIWVCWDLGGITVANAMAQAGFTENEMFSVGIDGGAQAWAVIRDGKIPFVASLAEPFEYMMHSCCEAIQQVEVEGLTPGDGKCIVPATRNVETSYMTKIITKANVPPIGTKIYEVFDNYKEDPNNPDSWINWGEPYTVQEFQTE